MFHTIFRKSPRNGFSNINKTIVSVNCPHCNNQHTVYFKKNNVKIKVLLAARFLSPLLFEKLKQGNVKTKYLGNQIQTLFNSKMYFKKSIKLA